MRLLFDTHAFVWWDSEQAKLPSYVLALCEDKHNQLVLSTVSIWEMQIKFRIGKLTLRKPLREIVDEQQNDNNVEILLPTNQHVYDLSNLPFHHRDPF